MAAEIYSEPDRPYIAKQFNGPIISAFIKAVYNYFHRPLDHHADYFKNLSIETADVSHLHLIGRLMGLQLFSLFTDPSGLVYLVFTESDFDVEEYDYDNGWAAEYREHQEGDGVFGTGEESAYPITLSASQYRKILKGLSKTGNISVDSMAAIDMLTKVFVEDRSDYSITYNSGLKATINVQLGPTIPVRLTNPLKSMFIKLFAGASVTVSVVHV